MTTQSQWLQNNYASEQAEVEALLRGTDPPKRLEPPSAQVDVIEQILSTDEILSKGGAGSGRYPAGSTEESRAAEHVTSGLRGQTDAEARHGVKSGDVVQDKDGVRYRVHHVSGNTLTGHQVNSDGSYGTVVQLHASNVTKE